MASLAPFFRCRKTFRFCVELLVALFGTKAILNPMNYEWLDSISNGISNFCACGLEHCGAKNDYQPDACCLYYL